MKIHAIFLICYLLVWSVPIAYGDQNNLSKILSVDHEQHITATIIDFGEFESKPTDIAIPSSNSHTGSLFVMDSLEVPTFKKVVEKSRINARIGTQFGIEVQMNGGKDMTVVPVRTRWTHPEFADGTKVEEWASPMNFGYGRCAGWIIEDDSEMVPGNWTVEIIYHGKTLASKTFQVEIAQGN